jgi:hypothetical protein
MPTSDESNPEWIVRKKRIDPRLDLLGWKKAKSGNAARHPHRVEEYETANGPADYALGVDGTVLGIVEAKKLTISGGGLYGPTPGYSCHLSILWREERAPARLQPACSPNTDSFLLAARVETRAVLLLFQAGNQFVDRAIDFGLTYPLNESTLLVGTCFQELQHRR